MNGIKWRFACQRTHMLAGNIILPLDFRVVEERTGKIMMRPSAFLGYPKGEMTLARAPDGSLLAPARAIIVAVASPVEIVGILRGPPRYRDKKRQRTREIVLNAAGESATRRGEIHCQRRRRCWNAVLSDNCA